MATQRAIVIEVGETNVSGGYAGESRPRFLIAHNLFHCNNLRIYLSELFQQIFVKQLQTKAKLHSVVIVERLMFSREIRDCMLTVLLRDFHVSSRDQYFALLHTGIHNFVNITAGPRGHDATRASHGNAVFRLQ